MKGMTSRSPPKEDLDIRTDENGIHRKERS